MIEIKKATEKDAEILALLGTITYSESHSHFIDNKADLDAYLNKAFAVSNIQDELNNSNNAFFIIYSNKLPVGYAKLVLNSGHNDKPSNHACKLDKIYILQHFIPLKIGQQFLTFLEAFVMEQSLDTIWLSVYTENKRAIRFYERNGYIEAGKMTFSVNDTPYENLILDKTLPKP
ncbi:MAG: GNAT family N-acetyltransferase [Flavobacteriaceae bacterium]|nr:GNAT family N-acetyltransferase [Flavobacteriaceae bacterium]